MSCAHPLKGKEVDTSGCWTCEYLYASELRWVELQPFLAHRGFKLRRRYQPDWIPSWATRKIRLVSKDSLEDYAKCRRAAIIDAIRTKDYMKVVIKSVNTNENELSLLNVLNSQGLRTDLRNNFVHVLDVILAPDTDDKVFVVMPKLITFAVVPFQYVSEVVDAFSQFLAGLSFLHDHNIVHHDMCFFNLMMDPTLVVPGGFHISDERRTERDIKKAISYKSRRDVGQVRYFIIDADMSAQFQPGQKPRYKGSWGQDKTIPEFQHKDIPHDPYKTDVCQLGNVFKRIVQHYEDLSILDDLVMAMTLEDPEQRCTSLEADSRLYLVMAALRKKDLDRRVFYRKSSFKARQLLSLGLAPSELLNFRDFLFPEWKIDW